MRWGERSIGHGSVARAEWSGTVRDLIGVTIIGLCVIGLVLLAGPSGSPPTGDVADLLVLGTVGLGTAAAVLGDVSGRLSGDVRPSWIGAALALYALVVVPSGALALEITKDFPAIAIASRSAAFMAILALLAVATRPPAQLGDWAPWLGAGVGALLVVAAGQAAVMFPVPVTSLLTGTTVLSALAFGWVFTTCWLVAQGLFGHRPAVWWMALGMLLVAAAHLHRLSNGIEFEHPEPGFGAVRLVGVLIMLAGTVRLVRGGVLAVRTENWELDEELRIAATHVQQARWTAAERDHELHNGLAGLVGITNLLGAGGAESQSPALRTAVLHELSRLAAMVEGEGARGGDSARDGTFDVTTVLAEAVTLRRANGAVIELDSRPGLRAAGRPEVLAQVIGNLLGNCARHAPGAAVRVRARPAGPSVVVEVADDGPGVPPGLERIVLQRGVRDLRSVGEGLGLYVSQKLLAGAGGTLQVLPGGSIGGCTVVVELPRAATGPAPIQKGRQQHPAHVSAPVGTGYGIGGRGQHAVTRPPRADDPWSRPVLVVDDHELVRVALVATLRGEGIHAYACTQATISGILAEARTLPPGVVLLDLDLGTGPDGAHIDGIDAVAGLRAAGWTVLVLTGSPGVRSARIAAAIAAGAVGQVLKISSFDALVGTVRRAIAGTSVMTPAERRAWLDRDRAERAASGRRAELLGRLTARERFVLEQLAKGRRAAEIAADSVVAVATVRSQVQTILAKLEVSSQLTAVALLRAE